MDASNGQLAADLSSACKLFTPIAQVPAVMCTAVNQGVAACMQPFRELRHAAARSVFTRRLTCSKEPEQPEGITLLLNLHWREKLLHAFAFSSKHLQYWLSMSGR